MGKKYAISLFSGGGGLDLGMETAGFSTRLSIDRDPFSVETLKKNAGKKPEGSNTTFLADSEARVADITETSGKQLLKWSGLKKSEVSLLYGGPPCQAFSVFGRRMGTSDPRGNLIWEYARLVDELCPKAFVLENVYGMLTIENGIVYNNLVELLSKQGKGYRVSAHILEAADFGVPQFRKRIFLVGSAADHKVPAPSVTHYDSLNPPLDWEQMHTYRTASEALTTKPLPKPGIGSPIANHIGRVHSQGIIDRYRNLGFGERDPKTRINKLHPDKPSFTIIVGSDKGGGKGHVHPFEPREVTPRESARMQTFPDWWEFYGNGRHVIRQVGNAVPAVLGAVIGSQIATHLFSAAPITYGDILRELQLDYLPSDSAPMTTKKAV